MARQATEEDTSPSDNQVKNLSLMAELLSRNWKARMLAHSLWDFYNYQLYCTLRLDDGEANRYRIDGISSPEIFETIRICISIRDNKRKEEGLVHELLHANLIPLGYPRFWIDSHQDSKQFRLAGGIINSADHVVMRPIFLSLGYSIDRFLGPCQPLTESENRVDGEMRNMAHQLATPKGYLDCISEYLNRNGIRFKILQLADAILSQRFGSRNNRSAAR